MKLGRKGERLSKERTSPQSRPPPSTTSPPTSKDTSWGKDGYLVDLCQMDSHQGTVHPALPKLLLQGQGPGLSCRCWRRGGRRTRGRRRRRGRVGGWWRGASWSSVHPILGATDNGRGLLGSQPLYIFAQTDAHVCLKPRPVQSSLSVFPEFCLYRLFNSMLVSCPRQLNRNILSLTHSLRQQRAILETFDPLDMFIWSEQGHKMPNNNLSSFWLVIIWRSTCI